MRKSHLILQRFHKKKKKKARTRIHALLDFIYFPPSIPPGASSQPPLSPSPSLSIPISF
jgi:hypothetical protein